MVNYKDRNLTTWSWTDDLLQVMIVGVAVTTTAFVMLHVGMHLWSFYGIAQVALKEGQVGSVQTFNQGEGPARVFLCIVVAIVYTAFIVFFLLSFLLLISAKEVAPEWMRTDWKPLSPDSLKSLFIIFFVIYATPVVLSVISTAFVFTRDRLLHRKLTQRKKQADALRGSNAAVAHPAAITEAGYGGAAAAAEPGKQAYDWDKEVIILVPTYQEPLSNLLSTINAITESDYPPEKIHVLVGFDDDSEKTLTTMFTIERILNGGMVQGYDEAPAAAAANSGLLANFRARSRASTMDEDAEFDLAEMDTTTGALPLYDDLPSAVGKNKYNGLLKIAHFSRSSLDVRAGSGSGFGASTSARSGSGGSSGSDDEERDANPRAIEIDYRNIKYTVARYEHGGKLHTQAKMFALVEERVNAGIYPRDALLLFVDSDTTLVPSTVRKFVDHFEVHKKRACATGFIVSRNGHANSFLQRMQDAEYIFMQVSMRYVEASFGSVTCLPGALTMIKYETMHELAKIYFHQPDVDSTFEFCRRKLGEDRFLTHLAMEYLGPFQIGFVPDAVSKTEAPNLFYDLLRQRRRWLLGSLTNELYMVTTPAFFVKYPALVLLRIISIMRLGGSMLLLIMVETTLIIIETPEQLKPFDILLLAGIPLLIWVMLTLWALWQRRLKSLIFFFAYIFANQILEMIYYGYALWTLQERTWGGPRAVGEEEQTAGDDNDVEEFSNMPTALSYSMPYTPPSSAPPSPTAASRAGGVARAN
ncbi:hypothetical protein H9P43_006758 [Blastocladiella emersonii ATCC 22665]|nr:hypothetical protein H9P43_006758 [Blastocladiella emersonii ATCC 22665]